MKLNFKKYNMISKASQPGYVYLGDATNFSGTLGTPGDSNSCSETHLFSSLVGSKNVRLTPIESKKVEIQVGCGGGIDVCDVYEYFVEGADIIDADLSFSDASFFPYHRFISLQSRWYYFRDITNESKEPDNSDMFSPNSFISRIQRRTDGEYIIGWRSITTDGSVLIKPSLNSKLFWNGSEFISDEDAFHDTPRTEINSDIQDYIYMKTLQYMDVVRSPTEDSIGLTYKKYVDSCLSQNTILMKRLRGSHCVDVIENTHDVEISVKDNCDKPTDSIMDTEEISDRVDMFKSWADDEDELDFIESYRLALLSLYDEETLDLSTMSWLQQFEYNFFNQLFHSSFTEEEVITDKKQVNIAFNKKCQRQNIYYGIDPQGERRHHKLPSFFAYQNNYSIDHPDLTEDSSPYPRYTSRLTEVVTGGRVTDGQKRVVVPPGAVFRTFKALPGFHSLYEKDALESLPDELHFVVDSYGNILGERSLPSPGLARFVDSIDPSKITDYDVVPKPQVDSLVEEMFDTYYGVANRNFFDPEQVEDMAEIKTKNKMYYVALGEGKVHTYINLHHLPVWVELDIFCEYVGAYSDFMCLYQKGFHPIAFDGLESSCYNDSDWSRAVLHSREVKADTYWNEIIRRYEVGNKVFSFDDEGNHWNYTGNDLANEE